MYCLQAEKDVTSTGCRDGGHESDDAICLAVPFADTIATSCKENTNAMHAKVQE